MDRQYVFYRDIEMVADWPEKIRRAQEIRTYIIGGHQYARVRHGREGGGQSNEVNERNAPRACGDCAVLPGELHVPGCDLECCPVCRGQVISCGCHLERPAL